MTKYEAAKIRLLDIAKSLESEEDFPNIQYHNRCRRIYTHSGTLERITNKKEKYVNRCFKSFEKLRMYFV